LTIIYLNDEHSRIYTKIFSQYYKFHVTKFHAAYGVIYFNVIRQLFWKKAFLKKILDESCRINKRTNKNDKINF